MTSVPTECQFLASEVASLEYEAEGLRTDAQAATGAAAWSKLAQLGLVLQQLDDKRTELTTCIDAHTGVLVCELGIIDVSGGVPAASPVASLWDLSGPQPAAVATAPVQANSFAFSVPIPSGTIAITVADADAATTIGPDFRSGPVPAPAPGASVTAEVVIGPVVTLSADEISSWFSSALQSGPPQHIDTGLGSFDIQLSSVAVTLSPSAVGLSGVGTVSGADGVLASVGLSDTPFTANLNLALVPSTAPDGQLPAELTLVDTPQLELAGPVGALVAAEVSLVLSTGLGDSVLGQMRDVVQHELADGAARVFSLLSLPSGTTLSVRSLVIDSSRVTFQPTLSCLGTALSTFQPQPGLLVPT